jgi:hypothetical protein
VEVEMIEGTCLCGAVKWTFDGPLESATSCNCSACRRYGALWVYGYEGEEIRVTGETQVFTRGEGASLGFHYCGGCGCVVWWRGLLPGQDGRRRIAVNLRLVDDPDQVAPLLIDHFDGFGTFEDLGRDGKCVKDVWF